MMRVTLTLSLLSLSPAALASGPISSGGDMPPPYVQSAMELRDVLDSDRLRDVVGIMEEIRSVTAFNDDAGRGWLVRTASCEVKVGIRYVTDPGDDPTRPHLPHRELDVGPCFMVGQRFEKAVTFEHVLAPPAECDRIHRTFPEYNCRPSVTFEPSGWASIVVTDIMNAGSYVVDGDTVRVKLFGAGDVPEAFTLKRAADGTLTDDMPGYGWEWTPVAR